MKLYIHIGYPKVGSTSIQNFLSENYGNLIKKGILYPKSGRKNNKYSTTKIGNSHNSLFTIFNHAKANQFNNVNKQKFSKNLKNELKANNCETAIISGEFFNRIIDVKKFIRFFKSIGFEKIEVIAYLRRPDKWLESLFLQLAKSTMDFKEFKFENFLKRNLNRINYNETIAKWSKFCENKKANVFLINELQAENISIEQSILKTINCKLNVETSEIKKSNSRLNLDSIIYMQKKFPKELRIGPKFSEVVGKLKKYSENLPDDKNLNFFITKEFYELIKHYSKLYNSKLAKEYFNRAELFDYEDYSYTFVKLSNKIENFNEEKINEFLLNT